MSNPIAAVKFNPNTNKIISYLSDVLNLDVGEDNSLDIQPIGSLSAISLSLVSKGSASVSIEDGYGGLFSFFNQGGIPTIQSSSSANLYLYNGSPSFTFDNDGANIFLNGVANGNYFALGDGNITDMIKLGNSGFSVGEGVVFDAGCQFNQDIWLNTSFANVINDFAFLFNGGYDLTFYDSGLNGGVVFYVTRLGFFGAPPVGQPNAIANATNATDVITQLNALLAAMRTLGLIAT